ncbi:MAG: hypothetical protein MUC69_05515 [Gemmatimonadales bacterium]|jgi:hypothetical protein|nr:hypothetical protein [Gemmatimonadales bacterium]
MTRTPTAPTEPTTRSPWPIAIVIALVVVAVINIGFIWIALRDQDPVVPSYQTEAR